jgi:glycosyltransferase involved in cell wall biosynthesis
MKPLVSVVIPCFNGEAYVREAIDSVLAQNGIPLEVIAVDDGSTDSTREILESYGDRVRRIYQDNAGVGRARNVGIAAARGGYVAFLDCDDLWLPGKVKKQLALFDARPDMGLVYCDAEMFNAKGVVVHSKKAIRPPAREQVLNALFLDNFITTSSVMIRKSCLESVGTFREEYRNAQDYDLWLRMARAFKFGYVDEILVRYRIRKGGLSEHGENRNLIDITILKECIEQMPELFPEGSPVVRGRLGQLYYKLGRRSLKAGENGKSRGYLIQSLRCYAGNARAWLFLLLSFLPHAVVRRIQAIRRRS